MGGRVAGTLRVADRTRERIHWLDSFRGLAVFLLLLHHGTILITCNAPPWLAKDLRLALDLCILMFMVVSGMAMWWSITGRRRDLSRTAWRYAARGAWLLVGCHVLITLGVWPLYWDKYTFLDILLLRWHITDAIAFCLWLGPWLVLRLNDAKRLALALVLLLGSRAIAAFWHPPVAGLGFAKEFLFGVNDYSAGYLLSTYPVGPYLAMFLLGTVLFPFVLEKVREGGPRKAIRGIASLSPVLLGVGGVAVAAYVGLRSVLDAEKYADLLAFLYPSVTWARLPLYLSAGGLLLGAVMWRSLCQRRYRRLDFALTIWGRTSLFTFVVQYFVIQAIPAALGWVGSVSIGLFGPLILVFAGILLLLSYAYARARGYVAAGEYRAIRACIEGSQGTQAPASGQDGSPGTAASRSSANDSVS
jgi:uncharacterized membrane protein